jgi:hypothetical protein
MGWLKNRVQFGYCNSTYNDRTKQLTITLCDNLRCGEAGVSRAVGVAPYKTSVGKAILKLEELPSQDTWTAPVERPLINGCAGL